MSEGNKLNGKELNAVQLILCMQGAGVGSAQEALSERLRRIGQYNAWRSGMGLIRKALCGVLEDIPDRQRDRILYYLDHAEVGIRLPSASRTDRELVAVRQDSLACAINTAMMHECAICCKDSGEVKRCQLRRALDDLAPTYTYESTTCSYRDHALNEKLGEYV